MGPDFKGTAIQIGAAVVQIFCSRVVGERNGIGRLVRNVLWQPESGPLLSPPEAGGHDIHRCGNRRFSAEGA